MAILEATHITHRFNGTAVLDDIDLQVNRGEFVALVGPNGSGKTTLLRILLGLLTPTGGDVRLFAEPPNRLRDRGRLGYVPQRAVFAPDLPITVGEVVAVGRLSRQGWWRRPGPTDRDAVDHALESVALTGLRDRQVRELSGGEQQRVLIARALASDPELLILDEPVSGVDADSQQLFRDSVVHLVREHGGAVVLVSHELSAVAGDIDRVVVLKQRVLFDGSPDDLAAKGVSLGVHRSDLPVWLEDLG